MPNDTWIGNSLPGPIATKMGAFVGNRVAGPVGALVAVLVGAMLSVVNPMLAAVLVGWAAYLNPEAFGILGSDGTINPVSRVEAGLGIAIGAITFSGSVIAFLKLAGKMSGAPIMLPGRHAINLGTLLGILVLVGYFTVDHTIVWQTIQHDLPALRTQVAGLA